MDFLSFISLLWARASMGIDPCAPADPCVKCCALTTPHIQGNALPPLPGPAVIDSMLDSIDFSPNNLDDNC